MLGRAHSQRAEVPERTHTSFVEHAVDEPQRHDEGSSGRSHTSARTHPTGPLMHTAVAFVSPPALSCAQR